MFEETVHGTDEIKTLNLTLNLPYSTAFECCVLSALMTVENSMEKLEKKPTLKMFFSTANREIFAAIESLANRGDAYDCVSVSEELRKQNKLDDVGGEAYLMQILRESLPTFHSLPNYIDKLEKLAVERDFYHVLSKLSYLQTDTSEELFQRAITEISEISISDTSKTRHTFTEASVKALEVIESKLQIKQQKASGLVYGVNTGLTLLDNLIGDIEPSFFGVIAARPSMGKTTLAQVIALNAARNNNAPTLFISLEMSAEQVAARMMSNLANIPFRSIRDSELTGDDYQRWVSSVATFKQMPLVINDKAGLSIPELRQEIRRTINQYKKIGLVIIDYLQLLSMPGYKDNRFQEISEISRQIKKIAKDFHCPVIALSQLSRSCDSRTNKRPMLSDLRESGQIEQDADFVLMLYRDEVYNKDSKDKGIAEIIVTKSRHGEIGTARVWSDLAHCRFLDIDMDGDEPTPF